MQFINESLNFENIKTKLSIILKQIISGSGNIGLFIILSIIVVATFESLGLSNREKNLEHRLIQNMDLSIESFDKNLYASSKTTIKAELKAFRFKKENSHLLIQKLKMDSKKDIENKNLERNKILFNGAIEQYLYENKENFPDSENVSIEDKIEKFYNFVFRTISKNCSENKNNNYIEFFDI